MDIQDSLQGSPYRFSDDDPFAEQAASLLADAELLKGRARQAQADLTVRIEASLQPFEEAIRSDLVLQSNRIEGVVWDSHDVRRIVHEYRKELNSPSKPFLDALQSDSHAYEVIGLYAATKLADQMALDQGVGRANPLREVDIREFHSVIVGSAHYAGRYKELDNEIGGSKFKRTAAFDVPIEIRRVCDWWANSNADPLLQAAVVHAWVADIHPFDDGNGRLSRLLANYILVGAGYPHLILDSDRDRGQYYDALEASDGGDITPLLRLFRNTMRRTVKSMSSPNYAQEVIEDRLLTGDAQRYDMWMTLLSGFTNRLETSVRAGGGDFLFQGNPDPSSFRLLSEHDSDGNSWFAKFGDGFRWSYLAYFGFESADMREFCGTLGYPSIFFSEQSSREDSRHPYRPLLNDRDTPLPNEIRLRPGAALCVQMRWGEKVEELSIDDGAQELGSLICSELQLR